ASQGGSASGLASRNDGGVDGCFLRNSATSSSLSSTDTNTRSNRSPSPASSFCHAVRSGISSMHGLHQVAHTLTQRQVPDPGGLWPAASGGSPSAGAPS